MTYTDCPNHPPGHDWDNGLACRWCDATRTPGEAIASGLASRCGGTEDSARALLDARLDEQRTMVLAEVTAWLVKKAREFHASSRKQERAQGDTCAALASQIARGAVRPDNLQMLPNAGFFEVDHTYASSDPAYDWKFRVDAITANPEDGELTAVGWRHFNGQWEPYAYSTDDWEIHQLTGTVDVTEAGEPRG